MALMPFSLPVRIMADFAPVSTVNNFKWKYDLGDDTFNFMLTYIPKEVLGR